MGGKPQQVNTAQATAANAGATQNATASTALATQQAAESAAAKKTLFGEVGSDGRYGTDSTRGGGTLTQFLDPSKLNVTRPTGTFGLQYNQALKQIGSGFKNQRGALAREVSNRGFGMDANFAQDQQRQTRLQEAEARGGAFTDYASKSYDDAAKNFWGANEIMTGEIAAARSAALQGFGQAGQTYSNLYGTAGVQSRPSGIASVLGAGLQAGGSVGAAAMCPVVGSVITLIDNSTKKVEDLEIGDVIKQRNGGWKLEELPVATRDKCVAVRVPGVGEDPSYEARTSQSHTFSHPQGGYVFAKDADHQWLATATGKGKVGAVIDIGDNLVYFMPVKGDHTYLCDGLWSLV